MSLTALNTLFVKAQAGLTTPQTALASTDFRQINEGFEITVNHDMNPIKRATATFGQEASVPGMAMADVKINTYIAPTNDSTATNLKCFDYFKASGMGHDMTGVKFHFYPSSSITDQTALTFWSFTGDKATNASFLTKATNSLIDWEINGEIGKPCELNITGKACIPSMPDNTSFMTGAISVVSETIPAVLKASTFNILGQTHKALKFNVKLGNTVELQKDMSSEFGYSGAVITNRESTWTATVYEDPNFVGYDNLHAGTLSTVQCVFGTGTGYKIDVVSGTNKAQVTSVIRADDVGINTLEISGIFIDNDFNLYING